MLPLQVIIQSWPHLQMTVLAESGRLTIGCNFEPVRHTPDPIFLNREVTQYSRRENVRLHVEPEAAIDDTNEVAIDIIWNMGVLLAHDDNSVRHRQPKSRATRERPIGGKFTREEEPRILRDKKTHGC